MMAGPKANALLNDTLSSALSHGGNALSTVPGLLIRVLEEKTWRDFVTKLGEHVTHERFDGFVTAPPLRGLGSSKRQLERICADDKKALDLLDRAYQKPAHIHADVDNVNSRPDGNAESAALRRLRKDRPDLHAEVLAGNLKAHGAMVEAGFRPKTIYRSGGPARGSGTVAAQAHERGKY